MNKKILGIVLVLMLVFVFTSTAFADIIKPAGNLWENPDNLVKDGETYLTGSSDGYVIVWEAPECNVDGEYIIVENDLPVIITATFARTGDVPWGQVKIDIGLDENEEPIYYEGWVMMSDLLDSTGSPAYVPPVESDTMDNTATETPVPTENLSNDGVVNISNTYNSAIVWTSLAIAAGALALVAVVLIKHKALNRKCE